MLIALSSELNPLQFATAAAVPCSHCLLPLDLKLYPDLQEEAASSSL
jgi:hypothetical protein